MSNNTKTPSSVMRNFAGSLILLVVALVAFFVVVTRQNERVDVPVVKDDAAASLLNATRRQSMRQVPTAGKPLDPGTGTGADPPEAGKPQAATGKAGGKMFSGVPQAPNDPEIQRAIDLIDAGNPEGAVGVLEAILKRDPRNESALVELAMVHLLDLKQPEQAQVYLQRVLDVNPQNQVVLTELVSLYEDQGRLEDGLQFLMDINAKNPDAPELSYGIGQMLSLQGRDAEAMPYLEKATASPDNAVRAYRDLAEAYSRGGDTERAIDAYDKAISHQEKDIAEKTAHGMPVAFAEERLNYTKMDKARELLRRGDVDGAQALVDDVARAMPGDESVIALQEQVNRRRG